MSEAAFKRPPFMRKAAFGRLFLCGRHRRRRKTRRNKTSLPAGRQFFCAMHHTSAQALRISSGINEQPASVMRKVHRYPAFIAIFGWRNRIIYIASQHTGVPTDANRFILRPPRRPR